MKNLAKSHESDTTITSSSGNVFADLGLPDPELRTLKAQIAIHVRQLIERQKLTQSQAAERAGLSEAALEDILSGRLKDYSVERLLLSVNRLGCDVEVRITPHESASEEARMVVIAA